MGFDYVPIHSVTNYILASVKLHNNLLTHAHTNSFLPPVAPGDYDNLTNFPLEVGDLTDLCLDPFNNDVRQLSFNVPIVNDNIPEDAEMFSTSLTLEPADRARLGNRVTVSPAVATVTIQDNDGKHQ